MNKIHIDPIILKKRNAIPTLIAELSYLNEAKSIEYIRVWGERKMAITPLYSMLEEELAKYK